MNELLRRIGERVRGARTTNGLTQEDLAERSRLHVSYISQIERGGRQASLAVLLRLSKALGLEFHELVVPDFEGLKPVGEIERVLTGLTPEQQAEVLEIVKHCRALTRG